MSSFLTYLNINLNLNIHDYTKFDNLDMLQLNFNDNYKISSLIVKRWPTYNEIYIYNFDSYSSQQKNKKQYS